MLIYIVLPFYFNPEHFGGKKKKQNKKLAQFLKPYCKKTKKTIQYKATKIGSQFFSVLFWEKTKQNKLPHKQKQFCGTKN